MVAYTFRNMPPRAKVTIAPLTAQRTVVAYAIADVNGRATVDLPADDYIALGDDGTTQILTEAENRLNPAPASVAARTTGPAVGVAAALHRGLSTCLQLVSDSTGTDDDEWFGILGARIQSRYPEYTLLWDPWNTTTQDYDTPTTLANGTGNGGGRRGATLTSGALRRIYGTASTSDNEVVVACKPATAWAPGGAAAQRTIVSRWTTSASGRVWQLRITEAGVLQWVFSTDGTAETVISSTAPVPFAGATAGAIRVTHDVNNGASGHTVTFYTSTDETTWTQLGTPVVTATAVTLHSATTDYLAGAYFNAGVPAGFFDGTIYRVEIRPGTLTTTAGTRPGSVVPPLLEDWDQATTAASVELVGAPVITMRSGAASGQNITYFDDSTRRIKLLAPAGQHIAFLSTGHNEGNTTAFMWQQSINTWVTNVKARIPYTPIVMVTQNPATSAASGGARQAQARAARGISLAAWAASQAGVYVIDTYPAFGDVTVQVEADGTHPTQGNGTTSGSDAWAQYVDAQMFA